MIVLKDYEELIYQISEAGEYWAEMDGIAKRYAELKKIKLNQIKRRIAVENTRYSETRLESLAYSEKEYAEFVKTVFDYYTKAEKAFVRYEALKNKFEATRSFMAFQRAKLEKGIVSQ